MTTFGRSPTHHPHVGSSPTWVGPTRRAQPATALRWWREAILVVSVYVAYDTTRGVHRGGIPTATHNGRELFRAEHRLHLSPEHWLNHALQQLPALGVLAAYFYATLHYLVTPAVLIWMYRAHPRRYRRARTWLAVTTVSALLGYWLYPVAPPRLLPHSGIVDTVAAAQHWGWWSAHSAAPNGLGSLVNEYAAMPSLHVGWALWVGWLLARHARRVVVRVAGAAYPVLTALVVMGTGNHYFLDTLGGAALLAAGGLVTCLLLQPDGSRRVR